MADKDRIIELQKSLKIAKEALEKIKYGHGPKSPRIIAEDALNRIWPLERKQPLQSLCGHDKVKGLL